MIDATPSRYLPSELPGSTPCDSSPAHGPARALLHFPTSDPLALCSSCSLERMGELTDDETGAADFVITSLVGSNTLESLGGLDESLGMILDEVPC